MPKLRDIYELVHSLNVNEKKHISILIDALGGKARDRYRTSFKYINEQKVYDAAKLKNTLSKELKGMSLTEANNYVYDFICKALLSYKPQNKLGYSNQLALIESFINRKQYSLAHYLLHSLIPELVDKASFATLLRAHELQEIITIYYQPVNIDTTFREDFFQRRISAINNAKQSIDFLYLQYKFFQILKKIGTPRSYQETKPYQELWRDPLLHMPSAEVNHRNINIYYILKGAIMYSLNIEGAQEYIRSEVSTFKERFKGKNLASGERSLWDLLMSLMAQNREIEWEEVIGIKNRLLELEKEIVIKNIHYQMRTKILILQLTYFIKQKKYQDGIAFFEQSTSAKEIVLWNEATLSYVVFFTGARLCFLNKDFKKALDLLLLIQDNEKSMRPFFLVSYKFLSLCCHYKLGNYLLLESLILSITRTLRKLDKLYAPEKAVLRFLKHAGDVNKFEFYMAKLSKALSFYHTDHYHSDFFEYGDYSEWLNFEEH